MTTQTNPERSFRIHPIRALLWLGALALFLLPLVAMQVTDAVNWTGGDFVFAAVLIGGLGLLVELGVRFGRNWPARLGGAIGALGLFLLIWANLAVGLVGNEDNPVNGWYLAVLVTAALGTLIARLRARAMVWAMVATALSMVGVGVAIAIEGLGFPMPQTVFFGGLWLVSAGLFRLGARASEA